MIDFSPECYLCILRQTLNAANACGAEPALTRKAIRSTLKILCDADPDAPMMEALDPAWEAAVAVLDDPDPFADLKRRNIDLILSRYDEFMTIIREDDDPFAMAVRLAIAGNVIDIAAGIPEDIWGPINAVVEADLAIDDMEALKEAAAEAEDILYLCDNAGEAVFDRMLIETLGKPVTYVVKSSPIINDATYADAQQAGIDQFAEIIDNGSPGVGTQLHKCSPAFNERFKMADLIISKGMANYESLTDIDDPRVFLLLKVKCAAVARLLGVPEGEFVVARNILR